MSRLDEAFFKVLRGKSSANQLPDEIQKALTPKNHDKMKGLKVPFEILCRIMPEYARLSGKALPVVSSATGDLGLTEADVHRDLLMYPGERASLFSMSNVVPVANRYGAWPKPIQAEPDVEGEADEFAEWGNVKAEFTAEGADVDESEPLFDQLLIEAFWLAGMTEVSAALWNHSEGMVERILRVLLRGALLHKIDEKIINGSGAGGQMKGVLQTVGIGSVNREAPNQISLKDLTDIEATLPPQLQANAAFAISTSAIKYLRQRVDGSNRPLYPELSGRNPKLIGYPVVPTQRMPALGASGDLIFGDFGQYVCALEEDFTLRASTHVHLKRGTAVVIGEMMIGGEPLDARAFTKLN